MKVLGIGESVIDMISNDESHTKHIGGPAPIALMLLSRLGIDCTLLTTLGNDPNGAIIQNALTDEKVTVLARREQHTKVNTYTINQETGARTKIRGKTIHKHIEHLDQAYLKQFDIVIIDRHEKKAFDELKYKKAYHTKILTDTSIEISPDTLDMIQYADYPIVPIEAVQSIGVTELLTIAKKPIIVTAGSEGSIIYDGRNQHIIPAHKVVAIDVQGAGDIYRGAFAYGILHEWNLTRCAEFANKVAALHCTRMGNSAAIPTKAELIRNGWMRI